VAVFDPDEFFGGPVSVSDAIEPAATEVGNVFDANEFFGGGAVEQPTTVTTPEITGATLEPEAFGGFATAVPSTIKIRCN